MEMALGNRGAFFGGAVVLAAVLQAAPVMAQDTPPDAASRAAHVEKLNDEGAAAYHARDYRRANEKFQQAYALDPDPNILYNIAKTYELLGDDAAALEKFEAFVNQPGADPGGRQKAKDKIAEIRARMSGGTKPSSAGTAAPAPPEQRLVIPTIIALGVGVAGVAVGTIFGVSALGKRSDLDSVCKDRACPDSSSSDISSLKTSSTVSTIGFVAGGVGLAGAAVLYLLGRPSKEHATTAGIVHVTPTVGPTSVGFVGTF
jgi:hypothetical protein